MNYPDFNELKTMTLSCRSKKDGKMLFHSFRLWYDKDSNSIKLISRYDNTLCMETFSDDTTTIMIPNTYISNGVLNKMNQLYGVYFNSIQGYSGIKRHNSHYITLNNKRYIYVPKQIVIRNGQLVQAADYYEDVIDNVWKNEYAQTSKKNRAAFTALHKIIPLDSETKIKSIRPFPMYDINSCAKVTELIMTTSEPTAKDVEIIREMLCIHRTDTNLRILLQNIINSERYDRANKAGKVTLVATPNYAR